MATEEQMEKDTYYFVSYSYELPDGRIKFKSSYIKFGYNLKVFDYKSIQLDTLGLILNK